MKYKKVAKFIILTFSFLYGATGVAQIDAPRYFEVGFHGKPDSIDVLIAAVETARWDSRYVEAHLDDFQIGRASCRERVSFTV